MDSDKALWKGGFEKPPQSYWIASTEQPDYPALEEDITADVAVVGGGIAGITAAYLLKSEGLKVVLIEADRILKGTTGHTTAKLTSQHSLIYYKIRDKLGEEMARQYAQANEAAIEMVESLVKEKGIDCDFKRCPAYVYTQQDSYVSKIESEVAAASSFGIKASYQEKIPLPFEIKAAVRFENQARFHPRKFLLSLAQDIPGGGSHIFQQTRALDIEEKNGKCVVHTANNRKVTASKVVVATHFPFYDGMGLYFARIFPDRSYALGIKIKEKYPGGMYITAEDPGRSLRVQEDGDGELVIVGGEHHKTGQGGDTTVHYENLVRFAEDTFSVVDMPYRWSTQDYTSADEVPYIGYLTSRTRNIFVATGFNKWGMTNGTVSGMLIRDLIIKGKSPWQDVYNPSRFALAASAKKLILENVNVAKELIGGKLTAVPSDVEIKPGEARVFDLEGKKVGAYRDEKSQLHIVDTTCTHMGCELKWNSAEKSWDCPCHGSRFTYEGEIIEGPALRPIKPEMREEA